MTRVERVRYEALQRVRDFADLYGARFPEGMKGAEAFTVVRKAVTDIEAGWLTQALILHQREHRHAWRRRMMKPMRAIARSSRLVETAAGTRLRLTMPERRSDAVLIATARTFLREAEAHRDQMISFGLPEAALVELADVTAAFEKTVSGPDVGRAGLVAAKARVRQAIASGFEAIRMLDIVVANTIGDDRPVMAEWRRDRLVVEHKGHGRRRARPSV